MTIDYKRLERNLSREFRQYHVAAQVYRVALVFLGVLALQLKDGWHDWTWKGLYALGVAAACATLRHFAPTVSWKLVLDHIRVAQALEAQKTARDAERSATPVPPPASADVYTPVPPDPKPASAPIPPPS